MESVLLKCREAYSNELYRALEQMVAYLQGRYAMIEHFNGKDELKFRRSGKTLFTLYLRRDRIQALVIFGQREREAFETVRGQFSSHIQQYYDASKTYHDGKWMWIDIVDEDYVLEVLRLVGIKKRPNKASITMCGYRCDLCKAYVRNIRKHDQRAELVAVWKKHYDLDYHPGEIYCDGCRSKKKDAQFMDKSCPVRNCVLNRQINSCADCSDYPCEAFASRTGHCFADVKDRQGVRFDEAEFEQFLTAFDNKTRIDRLRGHHLL